MNTGSEAQESPIAILSTLGPSSLNATVIRRLDEIGISLFRINLSHTRFEDLAGVIDLIRSHTQKPICLDTEGAQVRTGTIQDGGVDLHHGTTVELVGEPMTGTSSLFSLTPFFIVKDLEVGDLISIDHHGVLVRVIARGPDRVTVDVLNGGLINSNQAVTVNRQLSLPSITEKDGRALALGLSMGVRHFALSFAGQPKDVTDFRAVVGSDSFLISKIESLSGLRNLDEIIRLSDAILIDRGDLSQELAIEKIPFAQKRIIAAAKALDTPAYVATNLLESMVSSPTPTRAEINDILNTILDGASGLVLAAETAVGRYPIQCAAMVARVIAQSQGEGRGASLAEMSGGGSEGAASPHGATVVLRPLMEEDQARLEALPRLAVGTAQLMDLQSLACGAFSPLSGFMTREELDGVLENHRLPDGSAWPLTILLRVTARDAGNLGPGDDVALAHADTGVIYGVLHVRERYQVPLAKLAQGLFGTEDPHHPGVRRLLDGCETLLGGPVQLVRRYWNSTPRFEYTPTETVAIFEAKGWSRVLGFTAHSVIDRFDEHVMASVFDDYHCDGLFIHAALGAGDEAASGIVVRTYAEFLEQFRWSHALLGALPTYPQHAGAREAVFLALVQKNYGCSHVIVGGRHPDDGSSRATQECRDLFTSLGDMGVTPIFPGEVFYCGECSTYACADPDHRQFFRSSSGAEIHRTLLGGKLPPAWAMHESLALTARAELGNH